MKITLTDYLDKVSLSSIERIDLAIKIVLALNKLHLSTPPQYLKNNRLHPDDILIDDDNNISFKENTLSGKPGITSTDPFGENNTTLVNSIFLYQEGNPLLFSKEMDFWPYTASKPRTSNELLHQLEYFKFAIEGKTLDLPPQNNRIKINNIEHLIYILSRHKAIDWIIQYNFDKNHINQLLHSQNEHVLNALSSILEAKNPLDLSFISWLQASIKNTWPQQAQEFDSIVCLKTQEEECAQNKLLQTKNEGAPDLIITSSKSEKEKSSTDSDIMHSSIQTTSLKQEKEKLFDNIIQIIAHMQKPKAGWKERWSLASKENIKIDALSRVQCYLKQHANTIDETSLQAINQIVLNICQYKRNTTDFRETHSSKEFKSMYKDLKDTVQVMSHKDAEQLIQNIANGTDDTIQELIQESNTPDTRTSFNHSK